MSLDELDEFLSTGILNMYMYSLGHNEMAFGETLTFTDKSITKFSTAVKTKYSISYFGSRGNPIFIHIRNPIHGYAVCTIVLSLKFTAIRLKQTYFGHTEESYTVYNNTSEKEYLNLDGYSIHKIDYKLYKKLRKCRNFYDAYYFGEK